MKVISFPQFQHSGVVKGLTIEEFHRAHKGKKRSDGMMLMVLDQKLKSHAPATLVISQDLYMLMSIYEIHFHQDDIPGKRNSNIFF